MITKNEEKTNMAEEQENCSYCHDGKGIGDSEEKYDEEAEGIFIIDGEIISQADCGCIRSKGKINYCPMCGRKLDGK